MGLVGLARRPAYGGQSGVELSRNPVIRGEPLGFLSTALMKASIAVCAAATGRELLAELDAARHHGQLLRRVAFP